MVRKRFPIVSTAIAIGVGLVTLYFYFFPTPGNQVFRAVLLKWAITLAAVALLVGVFNLLSVHAKKISEGNGQWFYSTILILSLLTTFALVLILGPNGRWARLIFTGIQVPIETSLMALLAFSLAYASARLLRRKPSSLSILFVITVLLVLLGTGPFATEQMPVFGPLLRDMRAWIAQVPAAAGARGILLGVALGTLATGLRILVGADRPYGS